jgi:hypothetical protein
MKTEVVDSVEETDSVKSIWQEIRGYLTPQRDQVYEAIHSYPPPIPACDVQFNHLLEKRSQLAQELSRLNSLTKQNLPRLEQLQLADEFIDISICLSEEAKQKIRMDIERIRQNNAPVYPGV